MNWQVTRYFKDVIHPSGTKGFGTQTKHQGGGGGGSKWTRSVSQERQTLQT